MAALVLACGEVEREPDPWLQGLQLNSIEPAVLLPNSNVRLAGAHFVDSTLGRSELHVSGTFTAEDGSTSVVGAGLGPLSFVDFDEMELSFGGRARALFPAGDGSFTGEAWLKVDSSLDGRTYESPAVSLLFELRDQLTPVLSDAQSGGLFFVNDRVDVLGDGFLLSEGEGESFARISGCFQATGDGECIDVSTQEFSLTPGQPQERTGAYFVLEPQLTGIVGGVFTGALELVNRHTGGVELASEPSSISYELLPPTLFSVEADGVSLGQYVEFLGGGFVSATDGDGSGGTELFLEGVFTPSGADSGTAVDLLLLPEVLEGRTIRYVMNEDDALGRAIDLRLVTGHFEGTVRLRVAYDGDVEVGSVLSLSFDLEPVKQVVYLRFLPDYVNTLRHFGLRAVDQEIRRRVLSVVSRDYEAVNLEVRDVPPTDFALYSTVDIAGEDLNGLGLLGYDNTAGKDVGNVRLYDHIGGVNAVTQQDGYPGFGGVFIESMFAFSRHPKGLAEGIPGADELFDEIFDAFRPDITGGEPVRASDFGGGGFSAVSTDPGCPAQERGKQIECAVWVLGNIIGTTVSHEIAHSLGLANPEVPGAFHNGSDEQGRLMDGGSARPFAERAQLGGEGPGRFCRSAYDYLREILPSELPANYEGRESCF
ncbi:MAG: hypothetical protein GY811_12875 [Myxococcales bacterium]|nr:hypothetical protein [Myxococcales bacterium]